MLFKMQLIEKIVRGEKCETRRLVKPDSNIFFTPKFTCVIRNGRTLYETGKTYTICYGRAKPQVFYMWFRAAEMRDEPVLDFAHLVTARVGETRVTAESLAKDQCGDEWKLRLVELGYKPLSIRLTALRQEALQEITFSSAIAEGVLPTPEYTAEENFSILWDTINKKKGERWQDNPQVYVLGFEVVK